MHNNHFDPEPEYIGHLIFWRFFPTYQSAHEKKEQLRAQGFYAQVDYNEVLDRGWEVYAPNTRVTQVSICRKSAAYPAADPR